MIAPVKEAVIDAPSLDNAYEIFQKDNRENHANNRVMLTIT